MIFTASNLEEAEKIAQKLVEKKIAAYVNVFDIFSIYRWKDKIDQEKEALGIIKTKRELMENIIEEIKTHHSYECPEVIAIPIIAGSTEYLNWIDDSVQK